MTVNMITVLWDVPPYSYVKTFIQSISVCVPDDM